MHVKSASFSTDNSRTSRLSIFYRISNHKIVIPKYLDNALTDFARESVGVYPFRGSYVREFELSHSNLENRITK